MEEIKESLIEHYELANLCNNDFVSLPLGIIRNYIDILNKHDNQPDYTSAFDEIFEKSHYKNITMEDMIDFSKKYNLRGE